MRKRIERSAKLALACGISLFLPKEKIGASDFAPMRIERLLVVRQHNQMGDMLLAVPAFRGLRRRFPDARITLVAAPINADVMRRNPYVDEVMVYAKERHRRSPFALVRFIAELRRRRFDASIVLNTVSFSVTSMLLSVASGARIRIGSTSRPFGHDLSSRFYHLELPLPSESEVERMHESAHNVYPLSVIGVREDDLTSALVPLPEEERDGDRFIAASFGKGARFIVVHPGAGKRRNRWPAARFAEVVGALRERFGLEAVAVCGPVDGAALDAFLTACRTSPVVLSCPPVGFLGAIMKRCALTLCNDTGIMHVAGAVGARCVAVFGPTDPARWKPVNGTVVAVRGKNESIESVGAGEVLDAAERLLGS